MTGRKLYCANISPNEPPKFWVEDLDPGAVDDKKGKILSEISVETALKKTIQRIGRGDYAIAIVPTEFTHLGHYRFSGIPKEQIDIEVENRATEDSPFVTKIDDLYEKDAISILRQDFVVDQQSNVVDVVVSVFPQEIIDEYTKILGLVEIPLARIVTADFSVLRTFYDAFYDEIQDESIVLIVVNEHSCSVIPIEGGVPRYQRTIAIGYSESDVNSIQIQNLCSEVQTSIRYYQQTRGHSLRFDRIFVIGPDGRATTSLVDHFAARGESLNVINDLFEFLAVDADHVDTERLTMLGSIETPSRQSGSGYFGNSIEFKLDSGREKEELIRYELARWLPILFLGSSIVLAGMSVKQRFDLSRLDAILSDRTLQVQRLESVRQQAARLERIQSQAKDIREAIDLVTRQSHNYSPAMRFIIESLPPSIVLNSVTINEGVWQSSGTADTVEALIRYIESLRQSAEVQSVELSAVERRENTYAFQVVVQLVRR